MISEIKILGLEELAKKLDPDKLISQPIKSLLGKAALVVEALAKQKASGRPGPNVQTGRLRSGITHSLDAASVPLWAKVGTNVEYAEFVEKGHSQEPGRYVPAIGARLVSDESPAYPFLEPAYNESKSKIEPLLNEAKKLIESEWVK